jgi:L-lactate dehydrogenase complex protein LldG
MERAEFFSRLPVTTPSHPPGLLVPAMEATDLVARFGEALRAVEGFDHGPLAPATAAGLVVEIFQDHEVGTYLGWDDPGVEGLHSRLAAAGIERLPEMVPRDRWGRLAHQKAYQDVGGGLTGADAGLAESGSIVLRSGPGRPRMASLIPAVHVALLPVRRLFRSLAHYAEAHPAAPEGVSNLVVVTGPSRTGDIEQLLNLGVHGPVQVHVILVN